MKTRNILAMSSSQRRTVVKRNSIIFAALLVLIVGRILAAGTQVQKSAPLPAVANAPVPQEHRAYVMFFRLAGINNTNNSVYLYSPMCYAAAGPSKIMARPGDTVIWEVVYNDGCGYVPVHIIFDKNFSPFVKAPVFTTSNKQDTYVAQIHPTAAIPYPYWYHVQINAVGPAGPLTSPTGGPSGYLYLEELLSLGGAHITNFANRYTPYPGYGNGNLPYIQVSNY